MVIDYILDRKDGYGYDVKEFYDACMAYEEFDIARALDSGTEKDVKKALCDYVIYNDYPKSICKYINSENWLDDDFYESKKSVHKSLKESSKILAKNKKGKVVGYIEPQKDGSFGYAFGSPSQKEVIMFYVDTLEQAKDRIAEHSYDDVIFESKKSARKNSLKEEKVTDSLFEDIVFSMIKKFKLKKEYDVERPSWTVFNFRHKNKDAQFAITFDERGYGDFLYGEVLAFGDEKDDIFKYKTDEVKINSYDIEKECSNIIADCFTFIDTNKKITIFESKKSVRKSLKEYLVKGLDVDFVVDHLLSLEDLDNFDLINKLSDLWKVYNKSWNKFNKSLSDLWKVMKDIEKLDSFDKTCKEIIDAWYDDIEKIFYSDDNLENLKLNYGFEGNDVF